MASPVNDTKIVRPIVQSLVHLASVKVAITFCNDFHMLSLEQATFNMNKGICYLPFENPFEVEGSRAQQSLHLIPAGLRKTMLYTVQSMNCIALHWQFRQLHTWKLSDKDYTIYWRYDGRIDAPKTVQHLILNTNINIRTRFFLACNYCLEENIRSLWAEMVANGQTDNLKTDTDTMVRFWVGRMCNESLVPWRQDVQKFFNDPENGHDGARYSTFFPALQPEDRKRFLGFLQHAEEYDYLLCLYAATKEEEEDILKKDPLKLLCAYFEGPLQNFFLETVKQMWKYINEADFLFLLDLFFFMMHHKQCVANYQELFEMFWESSPILLQESVRQMPEISEKIDSCLNELKRKRKSLFDKPSISKKKKVETQMKK